MMLVDDAKFLRSVRSTSVRSSSAGHLKECIHLAFRVLVDVFLVEVQRTRKEVVLDVGRNQADVDFVKI